MTKTERMYTLEAIPTTREEALAAIERMIKSARYRNVGFVVGKKPHYDRTLCKYIYFIAKMVSLARAIIRTPKITDSLRLSVNHYIRRLLITVNRLPRGLRKELKNCVTCM